MIKSVRGTYDILPADISLWYFLEQTAREVFMKHCFSEIRTPIFENTELFSRSIGEATDIVEKEMYTIPKDKGAGITLRPEATASVVRAFLEHRLYDLGAVQRLFYIGPMFRHERPQAGRLRQFHQLGVELLGGSHPALDAEVIQLLCILLGALGLKNYVLKINTLGTQADKANLSRLLKERLAPYVTALSDESKRRFEKNVFRILDSKNEIDRQIVNEIDIGHSYLSDESAAYYRAVKSYLDSMNIAYTEDHSLVRGLDYYTHTVFEISHSALGAQDAIAAGGRYDRLVEDLGGPPQGAVGFAAGMERLLMALKSSESCERKEKAFDVYLIALGNEAFDKNFLFKKQLLEKNIRTEMDYDTRSLRSQLRKANRLDVRYCIIRGEDEMKNGTLRIKAMRGDAQEIILKEDDVFEFFKQHLTS